jgi:hypothetical protein
VPSGLMRTTVPPAMPSFTEMFSVAACFRERDWLMILVPFWHGLRASEVTGFTLDAVRDGHTPRSTD